MSCPPLATRRRTRSTCSSTDASPTNQTRICVARSSGLGQQTRDGIAAQRGLERIIAALGDRPPQQPHALLPGFAVRFRLADDRAARGVGLHDPPRRDIGVEEPVPAALNASPPMLLLPAPLQPASTKICGGRASDFSHAGRVRLGALCCGGSNLAELARRRLERLLHRRRCARRLHPLEHRVELAGQPVERMLVGAGQRAVLLERDEDRLRLALLGDRHRPAAHRGVEQLAEPVLGLAGRDLRRIHELALPIAIADCFCHVGASQGCHSAHSS